MALVEITGWQPGFGKVSCTKLLQAHANLGLAEAKRVTDGVLAGEIQTVRVQSLAEATGLAEALEAVGACVRVVSST